MPIENIWLTKYLTVADDLTESFLTSNFYLNTYIRKDVQP